MPKVLIFESDARFADELKRGLEHHTCQVTVVGDATEGLQLAANSRPDLILLTVELPRVNGFSVCNKLKRDPSLKSVPLIIMSSDSNEDTFSQHRRLKHSRAEDYVHKPIGFDELLPRISALVPLSPTQLDHADEVVHIGEEHPPTDGYLEIEAESDEDTQFDTEIEAELLEVESVPPESGVDAEVDEFTENAFDALLDEDMLAAQGADDPDSEDPDTKVDATRSLLPGYSSPPPVAISQPPISAPPISAAPVSPRQSRASELTVPRISESQALAALDPRALAERDDAISDLQEMLEAAQSEGERQRVELAELSRQCANLERELLAARTQSHGTSSIPAPSPQEILGLREALNKKDKEILDLHGQLSLKSKELLGVRDTSLAYEREKTESIDRLLQIEREFHELDRQHTSAKADKEQAAKRADDFKRRTEKLSLEVQERDQALAGLREQLAAAEQSKAAAVAAVTEQLHEAEAQTREVQTQAAEQLQAAESRLQAVQAQAAEQLQSREHETAEQLHAAQTQAKGQLEAALAAAQQSKQAALAAAEQSKQAALAEASEDAEELLSRALETTRNAHARELAEQHDADNAAAERAQAIALEHQEARLRSEYEQALVTLAEEKATEYRALEAERDAALTRAEREISTARAATREVQAELSAAQNDLAEAREGLSLLDTELQQERARLAGTQNELAETRESLDTTRAQLEQERATLEGVQTELSERIRDLEASRGELAITQRDLQAARQQLARVEDELRETNAELMTSRADAGQLQAEFMRVQATASAALSKWEQDRDAIHKGREALQAALEQLTQIEGRPLN